MSDPSNITSEWLKAILLKPSFKSIKNNLSTLIRNFIFDDQKNKKCIKQG